MDKYFIIKWEIKPKNRAVYGVLLEYEEAGQIDAIAIAVKPGIIPQGAGAYYGKLRCGLDIYHVLLVSGYEEQVILG